MAASTPNFSLAGKTVFVSGASRGLGAGIAKGVASQGAHTILGYAKNADLANKVVEEIKEQNPSAKTDIVGGDLSSASSAKDIAKEILEKTHNKIDILILASGLSEPMSLHDLTEESWFRHHSVNIVGPVFLIQTLLPHIQAEGRIILFSTSLCANPALTPNYLPYVAAKGAVEQTLRVLAKDPKITGADRRITVNAISPGPIMTDGFTIGKTDEIIKRIASTMPRNKIGDVEDIVGPTIFLASPAAQWVNGQVLRVNQGMTC